MKTDIYGFQEERNKTMKITTNLKGFQRWMNEHPRKRTDGFFTFCGKELSHEQVKKMVNYAVEKGYKTEADIPSNEIVNLLGWRTNNE